MADLVIDDTGLAGITLTGRDGSKVRVEIDLWEVQTYLIDLCRSIRATYPNPEDHSEFHRTFYSALIEYIKTLGYPEVRQFTADRFYDAVMEAANNLGKTPAVEPTLASPASTAPTL